jgi:hypothetical protein
MTREKLVILGAAAAFGAAGASAAVAAGVMLPFSGDGNTINGCYSSGGALKVLTPAQPTCPEGFTPIHWNVTGPQGPQGPAGPQGNAGAVGPAGPAGPAGGVASVTLGESSDTGEGTATALAGCPDGDVATGGGIEGITMSSGSLLSVIDVPSRLNGQPIGWTGRATSTDSNATVTITTRVICIPAS